MYSEAIKELLKKIDALPEYLVVLYLRKVYGLTENLARQTLFAACRARACYPDNKGWIRKTAYTEIDSMSIVRAKAFRAICEFLPDSRTFCVASHPWLYVCNAKSGDKDFLVQIGYIPSGKETISSMLVASRACSIADREYIRRIVIVEPNVNLNLVKAAGYTHFFTVDEKSENWNLEIVRRVPDKEAWNDVAEG